MNCLDRDNDKNLIKDVSIIAIIWSISLNINSNIHIVAILYIAYCFFKYDDGKKFYLALFLIPNIRVMDSLGYTYIINILLSVPLLCLIIRDKCRFNLFSILGTLIFFLWELAHIIVLGNYNSIPVDISRFIGMLYCIELSLKKGSNLNYRCAWMMFTCGIVVSAILYIISSPIYNDGLISNITRGYRLAGYADDPNYFSLYICLALSIIFIFSYHTLVDHFAMVILIIIGFLTASKMCLIMMAFILIFGIYDCVKKVTLKSQRKFLVINLSIILFGLLIFYEKVAIFLQNFLVRSKATELSSLTLHDLTTGRSTIVLNYIYALSNDWVSLLFGKSLQYGIFLKNVDEHISHNTYIDVILSWGVLFGIAFFVYIFKWIKSYYRKNDHKKICIPLIVFLINITDLSCLNTTMFWWVFCLSIIANNSIHKDYTRSRT